MQNRSLESRISHLCQSRQSGNVEAKLQTFRCPGRAEVRKLNFISLALKAGRKCRSGTSHLRKYWQSRSAECNSCHIIGSQGSVEAQLQIFSSHYRAEVCQIFGSPVKLEVGKQNLISLTGPYPADCHCQC